MNEEEKKAALTALEAELGQCQACPLRQDCIAPVGGYGSLASPLVLVGEGPGGVEDEWGCPLIGPSGQLLDKALWAVGITRDRVYTTNVIKCRPKNNRTPDVEEADFCARRFLERELALLQPRVVVALGSVALHYLGGSDLRIRRDRGQWFFSPTGLSCLATYHPAYLLRLSGKALVEAKWAVFHDLQAALAKVQEAEPGYVFKGPAKVDLFSLCQRRQRG